MLGKLIKHDIRSTWRDFAGIYLVILLGVIFLPLLFGFVNDAVIHIIAGFFIMGIVISTIVITVIMLFSIFNTSVFSKEGYLTMTLPVRGSELVISKLVVSTMWIVLTGIVSMLGILIFVWNTGPTADLIPVLMKVLHYLDAKEYLAIALIFLAVVATILKEIAKLFLSCSIAHLKLLGRFRIPLGILSYFVLSWLEVKVIEAVSSIAGNLPMFKEYMHELKFEYTFMSRPEDILQVTGLFNLAMAQWILYALVIAAAFSVGTVWLLNHKLELD
jgi:hypothetical protein